MNNIWIFKDGQTQYECTSFPYAFKSMYFTFKKALEKGNRKFADMQKSMSIISPVKDKYGNPRVYSYFEATEMARNQGLLTPDGNINSREFKRR